MTTDTKQQLIVFPELPHSSRPQIKMFNVQIDVIWSYLNLRSGPFYLPSLLFSLAGQYSYDLLQSFQNFCRG